MVQISLCLVYFVLWSFEFGFGGVLVQMGLVRCSVGLGLLKLECVGFEWCGLGSRIRCRCSLLQYLMSMIIDT